MKFNLETIALIITFFIFLYLVYTLLLFVFKFFTFKFKESFSYFGKCLIAFILIGLMSIFLTDSNTVQAKNSANFDYPISNSEVSTSTNTYKPSPPPHIPVRESASGHCDCPYDSDKAGRICGGRSAYIRPNGGHPICYLDD